MFCKHCGTAISENARFCTSCGGEQDSLEQVPQSSFTSQQLLGYSGRINDPRIAEALKKINSSGKVFMFILAAVAVIGFALAGAAEVGDFELPSAFFIGLAIGGILILGGLIQMAKAKKDKTWDGTIVDKTIKQPTYSERRRGDYQVRYTLHITDQSGSTRRIPCTEEYYNYMQIGDRVRHHGGTADFLFEKYDKSQDKIIYCIACSTKNDINDDLCRRCKCPLLK